MALRLSALRAGHPLDTGRFLVLSSVDPRAIVWLERLGELIRKMQYYLPLRVNMLSQIISLWKTIPRIKKIPSIQIALSPKNLVKNNITALYNCRTNYRNIRISLFKKLIRCI
jgi:hypothetical protein